MCEVTTSPYKQGQTTTHKYITAAPLEKITEKQRKATCALLHTVYL